MRVLFYTQAVNKDGHMVDVDVFIDDEHCNKVAEWAAKNTTQKSRSGPVHAMVRKK